MPQLHKNHEKGQSLVELALSFTVLLVIVGGVLELGSIFYTLVTLRDSAQEGVLYASTDPLGATGSTAVLERVRNSATYPINANRIQLVSVMCSDGTDKATCLSKPDLACRGNTITVMISYNYHPVSPLLFWTDVSLKTDVTNTILQTTSTSCQ
jgi:Flp pilus assembly protein TadG